MLENAKFDIVGRRKIWYLISLLVIIPGIFCMVTKGFNFGIDFTGGTIIEMRFDKPVGIQSVREVMGQYKLDNAQIQLSGDSSNAVEARDVLIRTVDLEESERKAVMASMKEKLGDYQMLREEKVGATMGTELLLNALWATLLSWALIVVYVSFRFEFRFGLAAVLALIHDVLIVLAAFSFTQRQIDSSFVAALLTIVGYSINDTIVIFDRIRENLKLQHPELTEMEQKDFILSYFNVSREDEALMFNKSVHMVDKWRNSVRKKMQASDIKQHQKN